MPTRDFYTLPEAAQILEAPQMDARMAGGGGCCGGGCGCG